MLPPLSDATLSHGERAARALLGVDALYRSEGDGDDGLVVVDMSHGALAPAPYAGYDEAEDAWRELERQADALPEADRRLYYTQLAQSTLAFIEWRKAGLSLEQQLARFLHVPAAAATQEELDALKVELRVALTQMGYSGDLEQQCAAWQDTVRVPPDEVEGVLTALFDEAWERTARIIDIPAPKSDGMQVQAVSNVAFNARCNYLERKVELNTDPVLTYPGLKHLALHECYPGHYIQFKLREVSHREGRTPADNLLSVVNTASSSPFEGIADNGIFLLDWFDPEGNDHVSHLLSRYRAGIGTVAAWKLHAEGQSGGQVRDWLRRNALVGGEGWVENRMKFVEHPARSVLIWSYWWGQAVVTPAWQSVPPLRRADFLEYLYTRMHSLQSIALFPASG